jgi:hypothetical protein
MESIQGRRRGSTTGDAGGCPKALTPSQNAPSARSGKGQSGTALVEFALVLPLLAVLSLGVVDLGRAYWLKTRLLSAARVGSTYARDYPSQVSVGPTCADPHNIVYASRHEEGASNGFSVAVANASTGGAPIAGCNTTTIPPGTRVTVVVSAPFEMLTPLLSLVMSESRTLRASSEVVVQG